ncbi:hypothetical protein HH213_17130 [Duganella dendranthematis]|uniref:SIR2-like domain-containing protein n=1 Tax=Duganella dendranthematis TaxID=2728021 RepID=A0ABX6MBF4_9BURK|nr:hypothetical protein [Duganella dendranthematis]QJD91657.1 hypothetical protein HH213_17130 [Duganella dendranthematis]
MTTLVCIGYGFGDLHINSIIREWLELSAARRLEIVNPGIDSIPPSLLHLALQVEIIPEGTTDYFDSVAGITRNRREKLEKRLHVCARRLGHKRFWDGLKAFNEENFSDEVRKMAEEMKITSLRSDASGSSVFKTSFGDLDDLEEDRLERLALHLEALPQ